MPLTIKEMRTGTADRQRNIASLVGGWVVAFGCFVLFILVADQLGWHLSWPTIAAGAAVAAGVGVWIRAADL